ncbi:MAG: hypothetical protein EPO64_05510 [Nitrospirae bacterium]|nr:MAG: hypothetical protein EPO64_05510 [Nitrospirota bacterium]
MPMPQTVERRIFDFVSRTPGCHLEQLVFSCPDLPWNQLFLAIDRMSRSGALRLYQAAPGEYMLSLPNAGLAASMPGAVQDVALAR